MILSAFDGKTSASFDMLTLNAAAVIYIGGKSKNLEEGVKIAKTLLQSGKVANLFDDYIETTMRLADE